MSGRPPQVAVPNSLPAVAPRVLSSYRAPLGCPTQQEYIESVESRSATLRLLPESAAVEGSERVRVRIVADTDSAGWLGELRIEGAEPLAREVHGERCQDVALALALITVLRLDRRETEIAVASRAAAPAAPPSGVPSAGATGSAVRPAPAAPPVAATTPAPPTATPVPPEPPPAPGAAAPAATPESVAPAPAASPEVAPRTAPGPSAATARESTLPDAQLEAVPTERGVHVEGTAARVERTAAPGAEGSTEASAEPAREAAAGGALALPLSLAAHVGYAAAPSNALEARLQAELDLGPLFHDASAALGVAYGASSERTEAADLGFRLITAQLELCSADRSWAGLWLQACGQFSGGALRVSVSARDPALETEARLRPWFALGPSLHAALPLAPHWSLRALAAGSFLLVRDSLDVERTVGGGTGEPTVVARSTLYRPPLLSFELLLGVGYAF